MCELVPDCKTLFKGFPSVYHGFVHLSGRMSREMGFPHVIKWEAKLCVPVGVGVGVEGGDGPHPRFL